MADPRDSGDRGARHLQDGLAAGHTAAAAAHLLPLGRAARRPRALHAPQVLRPPVPRAQRHCAPLRAPAAADAPAAHAAYAAHAAHAAHASHAAHAASRRPARRSRQQQRQRERERQFQFGQRRHTALLVALRIQEACHHAAH